MECGGSVIQSCVIRSVKKNPNFDVNKLILDVVSPPRCTRRQTLTSDVISGRLVADEPSAVMWGFCFLHRSFIFISQKP